MQWKVTLWGTRGSLASPGPDTVRYGGNTSCVSIEAEDGRLIVLDAGTGIRRLGMTLSRSLKRVDILLTHLHMDHIQGLGFFLPIRTPGVEVHVYGPASTTESLRTRLTRYLSPPLFPVLMRDFECQMFLHQVPCGEFEIGPFTVNSSLICHPDPTVGFRIQTGRTALAYLPDHEPALGARPFPLDRDWTSGSDLAMGVDLLIHDAQYTEAEYAERVGWGHSSMQQALKFAALNEAKQLVPFHHDPSRSDEDLDRLIASAVREVRPNFVVTPGIEGTVFGL